MYYILEVGVMVYLSLWILCGTTTLPNNEFISVINGSLYAPSPYNLEQYCSEEEISVSFNIEPWKAAIFKFGFVHEVDGLLMAKKLHKCKINIRTNKDFWLVASIEHMKIRGSQDSSNKWICSDYLKFLAPGKHIIKKLISILYSDSDFFSDKQSERLCGTKQLDGSVLKHTKILGGQSTDMNSFYTASNSLTMIFHQEKDAVGLFNNSFIVVVTTFRHASDDVECEGKHKCHGNDIFCISPNFVCDGHVNCAFPGSGTDERICQANEKSAPFNLTSMIIIVLVSLVAVGVIVCFVATIACRMKRRLVESRRRSSTPMSFDLAEPDPSAPRLDRESTLPRYETVILSDVDNNSVKDEPPLEELPPQYNSLFPEGPPAKQEEVKDS